MACSPISPRSAQAEPGQRRRHRDLARGPEAGGPTPDVTLFLAGDVMLGRGIDQILPHPSDPRLYEPYVGSALDYVALAERAHGPIPRPVDLAYVWGDALEVLDHAWPHVRIINLETSITTSTEPLPKGINYKMHPSNVGCLRAAAIDCCVLANNHVLDWGEPGLLDTLKTLERAGIRRAGAGRDEQEAQAPGVVNAPGKGRVLVLAFGSTTSGMPRAWAAGAGKPGVNMLADLSPATVAGIAERVAAVRRPGDIVVASIHWGGNWGYEIPRDQRDFARALIDEASADVVDGHSSHHAKAIEIYRERPILYGCGDLRNDYEGISGYEAFRDDLPVMYLPRIEAESGRLIELRLPVFRIRRFRLERALRRPRRGRGRRSARPLVRQAPSSAPRIGSAAAGGHAPRPGGCDPRPASVASRPCRCLAVRD